MPNTLLAKLILIVGVIGVITLITGVDVVGPAKQIFERTVFVVRLT